MVSSQEELPGPRNSDPAGHLKGLRALVDHRHAENNKTSLVHASLADPGCLSRIRIFFISDPESGVKKIFNPKNCLKLSEILFGIFIPDSDLDFSDRGSRGQKGTGSRILISTTGTRTLAHAKYFAVHNFNRSQPMMTGSHTTTNLYCIAVLQA
jgi:hypothetical protein